MCRSSRCGLPPRGEFWPLPSSLLHILSGTAWAPGRPARTAGPRAVARGATLLWGWATRVEFPVPGGPPTSAPWGCPGWSGSSVRGLAGNVHGREGPWHRANWRATHPGGMGVLRRPASAATDREGSGGPAHGPPPATAPTMQRGPRAPFLDIPCVCTRARCALPPSRLHSSPGRPPPSPHPGSARSPSVHGHPNPGAAPGPRPVASRQLADRAGRGPSRAPSCPALAPGLPPSLAPPHPPPPTGQWPPTTRAGVRLCASPRPPHPPAPAPVAAAAALHPTPYTLLTVRRRVERSHQTRTRPITRESSPARESNSARVTHSVPREPAPWPGSAGSSQTPRLPSATAAACQHPRVRPQAPGAGPPRASPGATTARQLANPGPGGGRRAASPTAMPGCQLVGSPWEGSRPRGS